MSKNQAYRKHLMLLPTDQAGLGSLPKEQREVMLATQVLPKPPSYKAMALAFNVPVGTIKSRLSRARDGILSWRSLQ